MIWILLQRFGTALVPWGQLHLKNKQYATDFEPINKDCGCWTCKHYTRAYINCLLGREEVACHLLTLHNIYYQVSYRKICHLFINNNSKSKINCLYEHYFLLSWVKFLSAWKFKKIINLSSQTVKNYNLTAIILTEMMYSTISSLLIEYKVWVNWVQNESKTTFQNW